MNNYKIQNGCHNCKHVMDDGFIDDPSYFCSHGHKPFMVLDESRGEIYRRYDYIQKFNCMKVELFGICEKHEWDWQTEPR